MHTERKLVVVNEYICLSVSAQHSVISIKCDYSYRSSINNYNVIVFNLVVSNVWQIVSSNLVMITQ